MVGQFMNSLSRPNGLLRMSNLSFPALMLPENSSHTKKNHITPPDTAHRCLTLFSPGYSSSENMHYPVLARIQLI